MTTQLVDITIRPFRTDDYDAMAEIQNATFTDFTMTPDELRFDDGNRPAKCLHQRWVAECDGSVVGVTHYDQLAHIYHPRKFSIDVVVHPEHLQHGIGSALWRTLVDGLREHNPLSVDFWTRDDMTCRVRFLEKRGFEPKFRMWASELDLTTFDPTPFDEYRHQVAEQGIEIKSVAELAGDPRRDRMWYEMWMEVREDVPLPPGEVRADTSFEEWLKDGERPTFMPDAYFIALDNGEYIGTTAFWRAGEDDLLKTGLTAVRRSHRRRGIALALKLHALEYARTHGYKRVVTDNEQGNRPMLSINERLGFVKQPAWVRYEGQWSVISRR
jgi:mycothiol synthase